MTLNTLIFNEENRIKVGIHQVFGNLFDEMGFNNIVENPYRKKASVRLMCDIVMIRIDHPQSKLSATITIESPMGKIQCKFNLPDDEFS